MAEADRRKGAVVRFDGVGVEYATGTKVLENVTFELQEGAFRVLIGPSGAGKTTLLRLMYLATRPSRGRIMLFDEDVAAAPRSRLPALRRRIGIVFQDFRLLHHLSAFDNVALPLRIAGCDEGDVRRHVTEVLTWVGLKKHLEARPRALSGGQQQLVGIARAIIARPKLLLGDEPTGNVDDRIAMRLIRLFQELNRLGTTIVIATHNRSLADLVGAPKLRVERGRVQAESLQASSAANGGTDIFRPKVPAIEGAA